MFLCMLGCVSLEIFYKKSMFSYENLNLIMYFFLFHVCASIVYDLVIFLVLSKLSSWCDDIDLIGGAIKLIA